MAGVTENLKCKTEKKITVWKWILASTTNTWKLRLSLFCFYNLTKEHELLTKIF